MNPCEGFLDVLSYNAGAELEAAFVNVYTTLKKELRTPRSKKDFNRVCSSLGKDKPKWVTNIIQIICATSAITDSDKMVKIDISGSIDRFFAYVLNYATIHKLTTVSETRPELEAFRRSVLGLVREQSSGSEVNSVDSRNSRQQQQGHSKGGDIGGDSIDEYTDDFDDDYKVNTIVKKSPTSRPRPPTAMKRQMSNKSMDTAPQAPSVTQESSSVFEDYEDDFEKNQESSVFSDKGNASGKGEEADAAESVSNEYPEDFNSSVVSAPKSIQQNGVLNESSDYAADFDSGGSHLAEKGKPSEGSVVEYDDDFETGNSPVEPKEANIERVKVVNGVTDDHADDFDGTNHVPMTGRTFIDVDHSAIVPHDEPLTRDNSGAPFLTHMGAPFSESMTRDNSEVTFLKNILSAPAQEIDRDNSENTFLNHFRNFANDNKEVLDLLNREDPPEPIAIEAELLSRHNSEKSEASFMHHFDNFADKYKESLEETAALNAEKNRNIKVQPSIENEDGYGNFENDPDFTSTTPKSLGFGAMGIPRFQSERSAGLSSARSGQSDMHDGDFTSGEPSATSVKKLKKTISFVEVVEYKDEDLAIGSKPLVPDETAASEQPTDADSPEPDDTIGNIYVTGYNSDEVPTEKRILFVEEMLYEDDDLYIGSNEFVKAKNEKNNSPGSPSAKVSAKASTNSGAVRPATGSSTAMRPARPSSSTDRHHSKSPAAVLPPVKGKVPQRPQSAHASTRAPNSAKNPVTVSAESILTDPETVKVVKNGVEYDMIVPSKVKPQSAEPARVRPHSSPTRRNIANARVVNQKYSNAGVTQNKPPAKAATFLGNVQKPNKNMPPKDESGDRFSMQQFRRAAQPLDTGLRRTSPTRRNKFTKAPEQPPPMLDITKVRVRNADDLFDLLRLKLGEAARMIGDSDIMWKKRLEEALKTQQEYWNDGKRSHEYRALNYRSLRPLSSATNRSKSPPGRISSGTKNVDPGKNSYLNEHGELFKRSVVPTAHCSSGVLLCKLSSKEIDAAETLQVSLSEPIGTLNNLHQKQALLIKDAFDVAEDMMKQCTIAKYRYDHNPTSVNQKRLEILSVRSVRVVLASIEKVNEVCQLLKINYAKMHLSGNTHRNLSPKRRSPTRAQSAPARKSRIRDLQPATHRNNSDKKIRKRPRSAFSKSGRGDNVFTSVRSSGGVAPYKQFLQKDKHVNSAESEEGPDKTLNHTDQLQEQEEAGIYSDDAEFEDAPSSLDLIKEEHRGRSKTRPKKVKKKTTDPKHTCSMCAKRFSSDVKRIPTCNSLDRDTIENRREEEFLNKMNALNSGELRDHERKLLRVQYMKRKKMDHTLGVHNKIFCSWQCTRLWNNRNCAVQFKYYNNLLIDMAESNEIS